MKVDNLIDSSDDRISSSLKTSETWNHKLEERTGLKSSLNESYDIVTMLLDGYVLI